LRPSNSRRSVAGCAARCARAATHSAKRPSTFRAKEAAAILVAASLISLALAALAAALIGFFIPLIPLADGVRGSALAAGILGTLGTIGGMTAAENLTARLEKKP